jgi:hypothetical protein
MNRKRIWQIVWEKREKARRGNLRAGARGVGRGSLLVAAGEEVLEAVGLAGEVQEDGLEFGGVTRSLRCNAHAVRGPSLSARGGE